MQNIIQTINANEVNFIEGTLNKWIQTKQKPSMGEVNKVLDTVKAMQKQLDVLELKSDSLDKTICLLKDAEKALQKGSSSKDAELIQVNLQKTTKIVTEALVKEVDRLGLDSKVQRKVKHAIEEAIIELEEDKPKKRNIEESLKKTATILKGTEDVIDKIKKLAPYVELTALWLGKTLVSLGWC